MEGERASIYRHLTWMRTGMTESRVCVMTWKLYRSSLRRRLDPMNVNTGIMLCSTRLLRQARGGRGERERETRERERERERRIRREFLERPLFAKELVCIATTVFIMHCERQKYAQIRERQRSVQRGRKTFDG